MILEDITSLKHYQELRAGLQIGTSYEGIGLMRSARLPVLASLHRELNVPIILITDRADHALTLVDELKFWHPDNNSRMFPEPTPLFYEQAAWGTATRRDRLQVLTSLAVYHIPGAQKSELPPLLVAPVRAIMARTLPRRDFLKASRVIKPGQIVPPEPLLRTWVEFGYSPAEIVTEQGQFSRRGGLLDIWPSAEIFPIRIEYFGDEIETLRRFDPASQRTIRPLDQLLITPAREVLSGKAESINLSPENVDEFHIPLLHPSPACLLDYLPRESIVFLDDMDLIQSTAQEIEEQAVKIRQESIVERTLAQDFPVPYLSWSELFDNFSGRTWLNFGRSESEAVSPISRIFSPGPRYGGRLKVLMDDIESELKNSEKVFVVSRQISRLKELWTEKQLAQPDLCCPDYIEGMLSEGWVLTDDFGQKNHLLTDSEIFGWERARPRQQHRPSAEAPEAGYSDLKKGDWVVHVDYGIGRYQGLVHRVLEGSEKEFLLVEYDGGDQLFVPVHQADRLSRFIGPDGETPSPTRLGTQEWTNAKQKVREAVQEVAQELLQLYARRQVAIGHAFAADTIWQQELEASFPYVETNDQLLAIRDVKQDMEKTRPMDRLLCGDVGYGKTEVALRAAFKAVMDGGQVAILVPTTVLAQQHFETFRQRLGAYPVEVEMLSRFRTPKEQDVILNRLKECAVDIIIGTHRLIQTDVVFKDLRLVIIDEEQRFGVTHKEFFKKLRTEIDVLTLTATPIPRTLYMALTGVRDISTINTPPEERLPIVTHIGPYSPRLVRQAVLRELERGGQVFFVHNRVQTIRAMEKHLNMLVPEARVAVAHGQMPEMDLSHVMQRFTQGDVDVLLCTSIIESGLDIPNANTLIVDRGDTFGLAQLYQLRGRVGRGAQRAYAYFFRHRKRPPTPDGQERLETIAENTQLGAGYSIAMRDLEMRGAGELLGTRQHGYIASVGFHLYTRLLAQAVRQIRQISGLPAPSEKLVDLKQLIPPVSVDLPMSVGIPIEFVPDQNMRLRLYRRIADLSDENSIQALAEEFCDRFGPIPEEVTNLLFQVRIKILAEKIGLTSVSLEGEQIVLRYPPLPEGVNSRNLLSLYPVARAGKNAYWMPLNQNEEPWRERLIQVLSSILDSHIN